MYDLDEVAGKESSSTKDKGIDPSEVKGDDLLICSPTVPTFSLSDRRWGKHLVLFCYSIVFPLANILNVAEVAVANIKEID